MRADPAKLRDAVRRLKAGAARSDVVAEVYRSAPARSVARPAPISRPARPPCLYEGSITEHCTGCPSGQEARHIRHCLHDDAEWDHCARAHPNPREGVQVCSRCPLYRQPLEWVSVRKLVDDTIHRLLPQLPPDLAGIVGVPRSGMLPASILATMLHMPLFALDGQLHPVGHGVRGVARRDGPLLVVDDTVYAGGAMKRARAAMGRRQAVYAAVYVRPQARRTVDLAGRELPCPHLLAWNLFNCGVLTGNALNPMFRKGVASDFDGIFCHDEESGGKPGAPYMLPRRAPIPLIVTGRRERYRAATEAWLRQWGAQWRRIEFLPDDAPSGIESAAAHKARHFAASGCGFYVESCPKQAEMIAKLSRLPVICPIAEHVFQ